jgi:hypothetical protein
MAFCPDVKRFRCEWLAAWGKEKRGYHRPHLLVYAGVGIEVESASPQPARNPSPTPALRCPRTLPGTCAPSPDPGQCERRIQWRGFAVAHSQSRGCCRICFWLSVGMLLIFIRAGSGNGRKGVDGSSRALSRRLSLTHDRPRETNDAHVSHTDTARKREENWSGSW